jgi:hypothetical protein
MGERVVKLTAQVQRECHFEQIDWGIWHDLNLVQFVKLRGVYVQFLRRKKKTLTQRTRRKESQGSAESQNDIRDEPLRGTASSHQGKE